MTDDFTPLNPPPETDTQVIAQRSLFQDSFRRFFASKAAIFGVALLAVMILMALIGPYLNSLTYYEIDLVHKNLVPNSTYWFGTDDLGRDIFTRVWYGARISLTIGLVAAFIDVIFGVLWGSIAGLSGGRLDTFMMRIADILYALPYLLVVILLTCILGSGLIPLIIAMTVIGWINMARIVRGQILQLKNQEFVLSAKALGASFWRILFKHLIPNTLGPIIVTLTLTIPSAIFVEAFLSFLGLGVQAPIASWGTMASEGLAAMKYYPWRLFFPAFFISLTMLAFNLLGDRLRDALDPQEER